MMNRILTNRKEKIDLLNAIAKGTRSLKELRPMQHSVTMWLTCSEDPSYMVCYSGKRKGERVTIEQYNKEDQESRNDPNVWHLALGN